MFSVDILKAPDGSAAREFSPKQFFAVEISRNRPRGRGVECCPAPGGIGSPPITIPKYEIWCQNGKTTEDYQPLKTLLPAQEPGTSLLCLSATFLALHSHR